MTTSDIIIGIFIIAIAAIIIYLRYKTSKNSLGLDVDFKTKYISATENIPVVLKAKINIRLDSLSPMINILTPEQKLAYAPAINQLILDVKAHIGNMTPFIDSTLSQMAETITASLTPEQINTLQNN